MEQLRLPERLPFSQKHLTTRTVLSYIFDYLIIMFVCFSSCVVLNRALAVLYSAIDVVVTPFHQHFALQNYTLQYPYAVHERVPIALALAISALGPIIVITLYTLVIDGLFAHRRKVEGYKNVYKLKNRLWELNCGILGLLLAQGAAFVITGTMKNLVGKPRPDLIDRCQPRSGSVDPPVFGLSSVEICTQTSKAILTDGFRSFPSGHSSSSFAGLFYLSLYLAGKLHVLDQRGEVWRTVVVLIPSLIASCIAISRIMDARHHPFDVLFGSAMGVLVAWGSYRQYFPPVGNSWLKGRAYPIRTWGKEMKAPNVPEGIAMEPLRQQTNLPNAQEPPESTGANVFHDQLSRSQRQRGGPANFHSETPPSFARHRDPEWSEPPSDDEEQHFTQDTEYRRPIEHAVPEQRSFA